jgi:hypothetical protein
MRKLGHRVDVKPADIVRFEGDKDDTAYENFLNRMKDEGFSVVDTIRVFENYWGLRYLAGPNGERGEAFTSLERQVIHHVILEQVSYFTSYRLEVDFTCKEDEAQNDPEQAYEDDDMDNSDDDCEGPTNVLTEALVLRNCDKGTRAEEILIAERQERRKHAIRRLKAKGISWKDSTPDKWVSYCEDDDSDADVPLFALRANRPAGKARPEAPAEEARPEAPAEEARPEVPTRKMKRPSGIDRAVRIAKRVKRARNDPGSARVQSESAPVSDTPASIDDVPLAERIAALRAERTAAEHPAPVSGTPASIGDVPLAERIAALRARMAAM